MLHSCLSVVSFVASIVQYLKRSFFTRHSLVRAKGEVFVLLCVWGGDWWKTNNKLEICR